MPVVRNSTIVYSHDHGRIDVEIFEVELTSMGPALTTTTIPQIQQFVRYNYGGYLCSILFNCHLYFCSEEMIRIPTDAWFLQHEVLFS